MNGPRWEVDAILFDSDGVLVDSHDQVVVAWGLLATEFGLDIEVLLTELAGVPSRATLGRHLAGSALDDAVARLEELEVASATSTRPVCGAAELTAGLPADGFAIVTSATRRLGVARWTAAAITMPDHVVTADDVRRGKPDPEPFLTAAARLVVDPARCLVVEDSPAGGRAGRAAGALVVAVGDQSWEAAPDARVRDLRGLVVEAATGPHRFTVTVVDRVG